MASHDYKEPENGGKYGATTKTETEIASEVLFNFLVPYVDEEEDEEEEENKEDPFALSPAQRSQVVRAGKRDALDICYADLRSPDPDGGPVSVVEIRMLPLLGFGPIPTATMHDLLIAGLWRRRIVAVVERVARDDDVASAVQRDRIYIHGRCDEVSGTITKSLYNMQCTNW